MKFLQGKKVFITGHTGFKGSWLAVILQHFGAEVTGYALEPNQISHYNLINLENKIYSIFGNINHLENLQDAIEKANPEIIFHLAAQPLVRRSYKNPIETWETNVLGTLKLFESTKNLKNLKAIVNITTDKCYENKEWCWAYRENDELGGYDPYSASKAGVEILSNSYRKSFFKERGIQMATVRAGNVIGGGDFGEDRLIPSVVESLKNNSDLIIRSPNAIRPWQHVLEALYGYLLIAEKLFTEKGFDIAYNFGPNVTEAMTVLNVVKIIQGIIPHLKYKIETDESAPHEATLLMLDNSLARTKLQWKPTLSTAEAIEITASWYLKYLQSEAIYTFTLKQINDFFNLCNNQGKIDLTL